jgi:hypothetical protein
MAPSSVDGALASEAMCACSTPVGGTQLSYVAKRGKSDNRAPYARTQRRLRLNSNSIGPTPKGRTCCPSPTGEI